MKSVFRSRFNYYLLGAILSLELIILFFITMISYQALRHVKSIDDVDSNVMIILLCIAFAAFLGYYLIHFYVKASPRVVISDREINIGSKVIDFQDIAAIDLFSSTKRRSLQYAEVSSLTLMSGSRYELYISHYANGNLIRKNLDNLNRLLKQEAAQFQLTTRTEKNYAPKPLVQTYKTYRRSIFKSFMTYFWAAGMIGTIAMFQAASPGAGSLIAALLICSLFYLMAAWSSYYFLLSDEYLAVKNLLLPWKKIIPLEEIYTVETQQLPKQELSLRIITKDFTLLRFQSGLLNSDMFNSLINDIRMRQNSPEKEVLSTAE